MCIYSKFILHTTYMHEYTCIYMHIQGNQHHLFMHLFMHTCACTATSCTPPACLNVVHTSRMPPSQHAIDTILTHAERRTNEGSTLPNYAHTLLTYYVGAYITFTRTAELASSQERTVAHLSISTYIHPCTQTPIRYTNTLRTYMYTNTVHIYDTWVISRARWRAASAVPYSPSLNLPRSISESGMADHRRSELVLSVS